MTRRCDNNPVIAEEFTTWPDGSIRDRGYASASDSVRRPSPPSKPIPGTKPTAYFRPDDFVPEFGPDLGIPLYSYLQTLPYHPRPETVASQECYDFFVSSPNRHRHSLWDTGRRKHGANVKAGWRTHDKYLSRTKARDHLRGRDIYGCWGDFSTRWFAIDVDYHGGGDISYFLDVLRAINDLRDFFPQVRWLYVLNRAIFEPLPGEVPSLYEMGLSVVETGDRWHVNVGQKVPLNRDRDNVKPSFFQAVRVAVLNAAYDLLAAEEEATAGWCKLAGSDPHCADDAIKHLIRLRFGERVAAPTPATPRP
jgi:hypothetical protein